MGFSEIGNRVGSGIKRSLTNNDTNNNNNVFRQEKLNILAFETAKTMSRLVSLQKSLSDNELLKLRKCIIKSEGVSYLTSKDEEVLLKLACTEKMEDLDLAAIAVARLGKRCSDPSLNDFETMYEDLKLGFVDLGRLANIVRRVLGIQKAHITFKYLGTPIVLSRYTKMDYGYSRVTSKLQTWKAKCLSQAGRTTLIKSVSYAMPTYQMSSTLRAS
ncbi:hypothetical protein GIB67_040447 [Kingdonia uniflora]|uniref:DUF3475 domain-containing protein n=1 Tax=Kingdonia uniflora TaxID=39325 RepID=A0A7J7L5A0_9MAGN|nr:hypothetical protein GIB67_040447 [Kingdonia uniflora]